MLRKFLACFAVMAVMAAVAPAPSQAQIKRWGAGYFPDVPVLTQDGKSLHFYDDLIKGRIVVVSFFYTSCGDLCPIETARLAEVKDLLGDAVGRDIFFVSITVDPEHDTPALLKAFAEAFGAGAPAWQFLTGQPGDIRAINAKFGDRSAGRRLQDHRNEILIGNDATGDWERDSSFDDVEQVAMTIRLMDPKYRGLPGVEQAHAAGGTGYLPLSREPGQALFKRMCAPCHTIGGGDHIGPDLRGVADSHDHDWLAGFIMNPAGALARKDPEAVALAARFPGVRMPLLGLGETDANDVIAYLRAQSSKLSASAQNGAGGKSGGTGDAVAR
jgi:cytochrome oxidase Cu insertion factor (SCO1/SenC/PrrC family)/cytochrome c2